MSRRLQICGNWRVYFLFKKLLIPRKYETKNFFSKYKLIACLFILVSIKVPVIIWLNWHMLPVTRNRIAIGIETNVRFLYYWFEALPTDLFTRYTYLDNFLNLKMFLNQFISYIFLWNHQNYCNAIYLFIFQRRIW